MKSQHDIFIKSECGKLSPHLRFIIKKAVTAALCAEGFSDRAEVSVTVTDNVRIRELNREYRNIDRETDVLSFPMLDGDDGEKLYLDEPCVLGDIVISLERAEAQALEYGHSLERELAFLSVHSVLHLLGYDHETSEEDEKTMFAKQNQILCNIGLER